MLWASTLASALLFCAAAAAPAATGDRHMLDWVEPNGTQITNPIDPALTVQDLPLDQPPLVS